MNEFKDKIWRGTSGIDHHLFVYTTVVGYWLFPNQPVIQYIQVWWPILVSLFLSSCLYCNYINQIFTHRCTHQSVPILESFESILKIHRETFGFVCKIVFVSKLSGSIPGEWMSFNDSVLSSRPLTNFNDWNFSVMWTLLLQAAVLLWNGMPSFMLQNEGQLASVLLLSVLTPHCQCHQKICCHDMWSFALVTATCCENMAVCTDMPRIWKKAQSCYHQCQ